MSSLHSLLLFLFLCSCNNGSFHLFYFFMLNFPSSSFMCISSIFFFLIPAITVLFFMLPTSSTIPPLAILFGPLDCLSLCWKQPWIPLSALSHHLAARHHLAVRHCHLQREALTMTTACEMGNRKI